MYICIYYTCLYNIVGTQSSYYEMVKKKIGIWTSAIFSKKKKKKNSFRNCRGKNCNNKKFIKKDTSGTFYIKKQLGKSSSKLFFQ